MCTTYNQLNTITLSPLKHVHMVCTSRLVNTHHLFLIGSKKHHLDPFMVLLSTFNINLRQRCTQYHSMIQLIIHTSRRFFILDATQYWPFAREYSISNAAVTALQFWMADLEPQNLSNVIEWVYTAFFCSTSSWQLRNTSEEVLFGCFMMTLNDAFG